MESNKFKFTKSNIKKLQPGNKRSYYYDTAEPNLMLQVTPNRTKTYYVYKRIQGRPVRTYLGTTDILTPEMARIKANEVKVSINKGENPHKQSTKYNENTTLQQLFDDFVKERERFIGERTMVGYKSMWNTKISKLAKRRLSDITGDDLKTLHRKISENFGNYTGNHCLVLIKTVYNYAIKEERFDGRNPAISVKLNKTEPRVRYMEHAELQRFFAVLDEYDNEISRDAILMLIYTGARKRNVLEMKWADIDMEAKIWKIPQTKTAKNVTIALVEPAMEVLQRRWEQAENEWVFYSPTSKSGHVEDIKRAWASILEKAQITNLRIHDLRHTLATYLIANGADAFIVQRALTHKSLQSTQVYVNLGVEHLRDKLNDTVNKMLNIGKK
mgnify:FL=1